MMADCVMVRKFSVLAVLPLVLVCKDVCWHVSQCWPLLYKCFLCPLNWFLAFTFPLMLNSFFLFVPFLHAFSVPSAELRGWPETGKLPHACNLSMFPVRLLFTHQSLCLFSLFLLWVGYLGFQILIPFQFYVFKKVHKPAFSVHILICGADPHKDAGVK